MNVIILLLDAVRAHNLSCYGYDYETSPNIDEIAKESLLFENCFSQSTRTEPSLATIMSGKHPLNHGVVTHGTSHTIQNARALKESGTHLLPEILKSEGYETMAVDWLGRWHKRGYDRYGTSQPWWKKARWKASNLIRKISKPLWDFVKDVHQSSFGSPEHRSNCEKVTDKAIEMIKSSKKNFFLFVHYWDVHAPYSPPEEYRKPFDRKGGIRLEELWKELENKGKTFNDHFMSVFDQYETLEEIRSAYDGCINWVDEQVGRLIDYLRKENILDDTLLIVTADHGEALGEHGIYFTHEGLYDHTIHVPLILRHPNWNSERIENLVQHTEITPTVLDALNIPQPDLLDGSPVLSKRNRKAVFVERNKSKRRAIRTKKWKYTKTVDEDYMKKVYYFSRDKKEELFDLTLDPKEKKNVANTESDNLEKLRNILQKKVKEFKSRHEKGRAKKKLSELNV